MKPSPWWVDPWPDMAAIRAAVWLTFHMAPRTPRRIGTRWTTTPRGKTLPLPLPRSWLRGRRSDPTRTSHTH